MSPTLLEGAIAILLVWIAWRIGILLTRIIIRRLKTRQNPTDKKNKPPFIIDV